MYNKYNSYADVLESYMIAEEGIVNKMNIPLKIKQIFEKTGKPCKSDNITYSALANIIELSMYPEKYTGSDLKTIHNCFYNETDAIDYFAPSANKEDISLIKKYKPVPIYSRGNGDFYCITNSGEIKEYIHDASSIFDAPHANNFRNYTDWLNNFYLKNAREPKL